MSDSAELFEELHGEIWKSLEDAWNNYSANDVENFLKYCDQTFKGCLPETPFSVDRVWLDKWVRLHLKNVKFPFCHLTRQSLQVFDENVAAAVYGLDLVEDNQSQKQYISQRHTVVLRRKTKRWTIATAHIEIIDQHSV